jgi:hypothetical protein
MEALPMNKPIAVLLAGAMLLAGAVRAQDAQDAQDPAAVAAATDSATRWLAMLDAGKAGETWDQAAPAVQAAVSRAAWRAGLDGQRKPLGAVTSRKLQAATFTHTLPGAPAGDYVLIQYATDFANKPQSVETVVPMRLPDGSWKVSGYFVR